MYDIYYYNLNVLKESQLSIIAKQINLSIKKVESNQFDITIMNMISSQIGKINNPFKEELILFNCPENKLDEYLSIAKQKAFKVDYLAMVTSYNLNWTSNQLINELRKEKEAIKNYHQ